MLRTLVAPDLQRLMPGESYACSRVLAREGFASTPRRCSRAAPPITGSSGFEALHDASTVVALCMTMARAIAFDDTDLVIDLSEVTFMDAATVEVMIRAESFLRDRSRSLTLRSPSTHARRVLGAGGLTGLVDPGPTTSANR